MIAEASIKQKKGTFTIVISQAKDSSLHYQILRENAFGSTARPGSIRTWITLGFSVLSILTIGIVANERRRNAPVDLAKQ